MEAFAGARMSGLCHKVRHKTEAPTSPADWVESAQRGNGVADLLPSGSGNLDVSPGVAALALRLAILCNLDLLIGSTGV